MTTKPEYMLDTNICIYIQRQKPESVLRRFEALEPGQVAISVITWGEMCFGAAKSLESKRVFKVLEEFSTLVSVLPMPLECGKTYGQIRSGLEKRGTPIGNNDLWIAAHALTADLVLVTNNVKEFKRVPHLQLENWV